MPAERARVALLALALAATPALAQAPDSAQDYFARVDLDGDGRVSLPEFLDRMGWAFSQLDRDGDGVLEPDEQAVPGARRLTRAEHEARLARQFARQDADGDGFLDRAELLAPPR